MAMRFRVTGIIPRKVINRRGYNGRRSPVSNAGLVYEWNRGVIGVSEDGLVLKEKLDETQKHHSTATLKIADNFNVKIPRVIQPYIAGVNCAKQGILIMQFEGDRVCLYMPQTMTSYQFQVLNDVISPRQSFEFSYYHNEDVQDNLKFEEIMQYIDSLQTRGR